MSVLVAVALGCVAPGGPGHTSADTADSADTGDSAATADTADSTDTADTAEVPVDADGDGAWAPGPGVDPAVTDCDDADAEVNPATEVYVPAGHFEMGIEGSAWAAPVHRVTLSAYCLDRTEVTHAAFLVFLTEQEAAGHHNTDDRGQPLYSLDDEASPDEFPSRYWFDAGGWHLDSAFADHPVTEVWHWAGEAYCAARGKRLPTEAEWERAARGDGAESYPWGDDAPDCDRANHGAPGRPPGCPGFTTPVGLHPAGATSGGIEDLSGNAAEWVGDWFSTATYASGDDLDPTGPAEGELVDDGVATYVARISRGGSWAQPAEALLAGARQPEPYDGTSNGVSFRCARPLR